MFCDFLMIKMIEWKTSMNNIHDVDITRSVLIWKLSFDFNWHQSSKGLHIYTYIQCILYKLWYTSYFSFLFILLYFTFRNIYAQWINFNLKSSSLLLFGFFMSYWSRFRVWAFVIEWHEAGATVKYISLTFYIIVDMCRAPFESYL